MSKAFIAAGLVALATATDPDVTVACVEDDNITITIDYTKPNVSLIAFTAGDCNEANVSYVQNATSNAVEINMSMRACGLRGNSRVTRGLRGSLRTIHFDNIADLQLGRTDEALDKDFVFYSNKVNLTCGVKDTYTVSLGYGKIDADYSGDQIAGGEKVYNFSIKSVDSDYNATVTPSSRAGDTVYLSIQSADVDFELYKFSVLDCTFAENNGTADVTTYKLFDNAANDCKNDFLDFTMQYCNKTNSFKLSHTVFTFDPTKDNNYTLSCSIKLCDFDVTSSVEQCNTVENNCKIPTIEPNPGHVDGGWSDWGNYTGCESWTKCVDCVETRTRNCTNPEPKDGGADCVGNSTQTQSKAHTCSACKIKDNGDLSYDFKDAMGNKNRQSHPCVSQTIFDKVACSGNMENERTNIKKLGHDLEEWYVDSSAINGAQNEKDLAHFCPNLCALKQDEADRTCLPKPFCKDEPIVIDFTDDTTISARRENVSCELITRDKFHRSNDFYKSLCGKTVGQVKEQIYDDSYKLSVIYSIKIDGVEVPDDKLFGELCLMTCQYEAPLPVWDKREEYCVLEPTNGGFSDWSEWANVPYSCSSKDCGEDCLLKQTRTCTNPWPVRGGDPCDSGLATKNEKTGPKICDDCESKHPDYSGFSYTFDLTKFDDLCFNSVLDDAFWQQACGFVVGDLHVAYQEMGPFTWSVTDDSGTDVILNKLHPSWTLQVKDMCPNQCMRVSTTQKTCTSKPACKKEGDGTGDQDTKFLKKGQDDRFCGEVHNWINWQDIDNVCSARLGVVMSQYGYDAAHAKLDNNNYRQKVDLAGDTKVEDVCQTTCAKVGQVVCDYPILPCAKDGETKFIKGGQDDHTCDEINNWIGWQDIDNVCSARLGVVMNRYGYEAAYDSKNVKVNPAGDAKVEDVCQTTCGKVGQYECDYS